MRGYLVDQVLRVAGDGAQETWMTGQRLPSSASSAAFHGGRGVGAETFAGRKLGREDLRRHRSPRSEPDRIRSPVFGSADKRQPGRRQQVSWGRSAGQGRAVGLRRRTPMLLVPQDDVRQGDARFANCVDGRGPGSGSGAFYADDAWGLGVSPGAF